MSHLCKNCNEKLKDGSKFCGHCGTPVGESKAAHKAKAEPIHPLLVSPTKVVVLSIFSFGLYDIYWFMKQWRFIKARDEATIRPFWRALFSVFFVLPLFRTLGVSQPVGWAVIYIAFSLMSRLPHNWYLIELLAVVSLFQVQQELNVKHNSGRLSGYSKKEKTLVAFGSLVWAVLIWSFTRG